MPAIRLAAAVVIASGLGGGLVAVPLAQAQTQAQSAGAPPPYYPPTTPLTAPGAPRPAPAPAYVPAGPSEPQSSRASNIGGAPVQTLAPQLPSPNVDDNAAPRAFLLSARAALASGRTGEAQEALERAESRLLDRSVAYGRQDTPASGPEVNQVAQARRALGAGNTARALELMDAALGAMAVETAAQTGAPPPPPPPVAIYRAPPPQPYTPPSSAPGYASPAAQPYVPPAPLPPPVPLPSQAPANGGESFASLPSGTMPPPMPAAPREQIPPPSSNGVVWEPGHWEWLGGRYIWLSGRYIQPRPDQAHFDAGRWSQQPGGEWLWIPSRWTN